MKMRTPVDGHPEVHEDRNTCLLRVVLACGVRWRGAERSGSTEAAEQSPRWERKEEEEKDFSFGEGIMKRIGHVKRLVVHMGVVGKGGGV
jgi:hypothetical protein